MSEIFRRYTNAPSATSAAPKKQARVGNAIVGYGAVFYRAGVPGTEYHFATEARERISPTAFARALRERHDVRGLMNHDANMLLGRTASGTMRLSVDAIGLRYEIDGDPKSPLHQIVLRMLHRGDLSGSSFAFQVTKHSVSRDSIGFIRTIEDVNLLDVGPVSYPAYQASTAQPRAFDPATKRLTKEEVERLQRKARVEQIEADIVRDRLKQLDDERWRETKARWGVVN